MEQFVAYIAKELWSIDVDAGRVAEEFPGQYPDRARRIIASVIAAHAWHKKARRWPSFVSR